MPRGQALLLALRQFDPTVADPVLLRSRNLYAVTSASLMTAPRVTPDGRWTGYHGVNGDHAAVNTVATDLINILDAVEVPIVVVRRDFSVACFNKAAADVLDLSPSDIGRTSRDISVFAGCPRLEQQCDEVVAGGAESRVDFRDRDKWFVVRIAPSTSSDRQVTGTVLTSLM